MPAPMGALRGALTFTRFLIDGELPRDVRKRYLAAVRLRAFTPLEPESEGSEASGWCVIERPFDLEFEPDKIFYDRFVLLGFRVDKWRIPSSLLRTQVADEVQALLLRTGKSKLSRAERDEVKARVVRRLRKKVLPTSRAYDVLWDLDSGTLLFFCHSQRTIGEFTALFEKTFGLTLEKDSPYHAALRAQLPKSLMKELAHVEPSAFSIGRKALARAKHGARAEASEALTSETPEGEEKEESEALIDRVETTRFLGSEFLLWLWLRAELLSAKLTLPAGEAEVWLEKRLVLEHILDKAEQVTVRGAQPTGSDEAREAVRSAKVPVTARILLRLEDEREFSWDLNGPQYALRAGKIPMLLKEESDDAFLERTALIEELNSLLDGLYAAFLGERLAPLWNQAWQPAIVAWAEAEAVPAALLEAIAKAVSPRGRRSRRAG